MSEDRGPGHVIPLERWFVAPDGAPVGPLRRDQIAQRIRTGVVTGATLTWRDGFAEWRPLRDVPELVVLTRGERPPPPSRADDSDAPRLRMAAGAGVSPPAPTPAPSPRSLETPARRPSPRPRLPSPAPRPALRVDPALRHHQDAPPFEYAAPAPTFEPLIIPPPAPTPREATRRPKKRRLPIGVFIALAGAIAFGASLGITLGMRVTLDGDVPSTAAAEPVGPDVIFLEPVSVSATEETASGTPADAEPHVVVITGEPTRPHRSHSTRRDRSRSMSAESPPASEIPEHMREAADDTIALPNPRFDDEPTGSRRRSASAEDLNAVVNANRPRLRRCYERAARGRANAPSVTLRVHPTISASGRVRRVRIEGTSSLPAIDACVIDSVQRWHFPAPGDEVVAPFTVVFGPAG